MYIMNLSGVFGQSFSVLPKKKYCILKFQTFESLIVVVKY